jgi:hypothetical protein
VARDGAHVSGLLEKLAAEGMLRCPACRRAVRLARGEARCEACARVFALENGALDLYGRYGDRAEPAPVDAAFVKGVARALRMPANPAVQAKVARAVSASTLTANDPAFTAEIAELADRLEIASPSGLPRAVLPPTEPNRDIRARLEATFIEAQLPASSQILRTVRLRNLAWSPVTSDASPPVLLSYHWIAEDGTVAAWEGKRSRLPVAIDPGRALSVIASIQTPDAPGRYRLRFALVLEGKQWFDIEAGEIPVEVAAQLAAPPLVGQTGRDYGYAEDHAVASGMVARRLAQRTEKARVLEIGGGIHPQASALAAAGHEAVSADISFCMAQLGALYFEHVEGDKGARMAFVACDAHEPPFPEGAFDCAVMFAALHHFAEPARMLAALAAVVRPEGFIAVMCEPCVPDPTAETYLRDLRKGINEQVWTLPEYGTIFARAGLRVVAGHVDGASLKAILERAPA